MIVCSTYIISLIILTFLTFFPMRLIKYWTTSLAKAICFSDWNSGSELLLVEPVCCKKRPKIVPDQLLVWGIRSPLKVLNGTKLILDDQANNLDCNLL